MNTASNPRTLYVEGQAIYRRIVTRFLEIKGMETRTAVDSRLEVALAREWIPDLILMDLIMPEVNGFEAAKALCSDPRTSNIPIVAYSIMPAEKMRTCRPSRDGRLLLEQRTLPLLGRESPGSLANRRMTW